ncbi:GGDEF domain-containing protein [Actinoplanes sp. NPDC051859]|uniref:GGDEF domain-containing protein n=1 Tax=Actinoplanes sp. NPDC051859 TaxID=3363909 RepID=UPI0037AB7B9E
MTTPANNARTATVLDAAAVGAELDDLVSSAGVDIEVALPRAAELERVADELGELELRWRCTLLRVDLIERQGDPAAAMKLAFQAQEWAAAAGCRRVLSRAHELIGRTYRTMGDLVANLEQLVQSVDALDDTTPPPARVACLIKLADAYAETGSLPAARDRYEEAYRMAAGFGDLRRQAMVLNNWAYHEYEDGDDVRPARQVVDRLLALSEDSGWELDYCDLDTIARVELRLENYADAELASRAALAAYRTGDDSECDAEAELLLTLATVQRHRGDLVAAQVSLDASNELCDAIHFGRLAVQLQLEQAQLFAAAGEFEQAYHAMCEHRIAERALSNADREAQARNRQALFEVNEARRQAEAFRDQARRDALTGLSNRRYVDETLPALLTDGSTAVTAALLDLDFFKRINDTLSHEAGDRVLAECARLLGQVDVGERGIAARLGGEEFLLVITGVSPSTAVFRLEDLRRTIADHDWTPITGDLPVTISIGVTAADPDSTQTTVLARADEQLYEAKRAGRNRVCLDPRSDLTSRRRFRSGVR